MGVSSLIDYRRPNGEVTAFILEPWYVVLSCSYQFEELALKSPRSAVRNDYAIVQDLFIIY